MSSSGSSFLFVEAPPTNKPRVKYYDETFNYKIVVVGPSQSGKTQFIQRYISTFESEEKEVYIKKLSVIEQAKGIN